MLCQPTQESSLKLELAALERQLLQALAASRCAAARPRSWMRQRPPGGRQVLLLHSLWIWRTRAKVASLEYSNSAPPRGTPPLHTHTHSGNILEDTALLSSLTQTKAKASNTAAALREGARLAAALDTQRDGGSAACPPVLRMVPIC
jgi:hypothetical protein